MSDEQARTHFMDAANWRALDPDAPKIHVAYEIDEEFTAYIYEENGHFTGSVLDHARDWYDDTPYATFEDAREGAWQFYTETRPIALLMLATDHFGIDYEFSYTDEDEQRVLLQFEDVLNNGWHKLSMSCLQFLDLTKDFPSRSEWETWRLNQVYLPIDHLGPLIEHLQTVEV